MVSLSSTQRPRFWVLCSRFSSPFFIRLAIAGIFILSSLWLFLGGFAKSFGPSILVDEASLAYPPNLHSIPLKHKHVAVGSAFLPHYDLYLTIAWTLKRLGLKDQGTLQVYAETPFYFGFQEIIDQYGLYEGEVKPSKDLIGDIKSGGNSDGGIDLVIFGTCEVDMLYYNEELLAAWDERDDAHKFEVACIAHNAPDARWQATITEWARRSAIRLLPLSEHVSRRFYKLLESGYARSSDVQLYTAGYEHIRVDAHIPILNISHPNVLSPNRVLSNVIIQGALGHSHRDYAGIFSELIASLHVEPELWGYSPLQVGEESFVPLPNTTLNHLPPFQVHLAGQGWMEIPPELKNIVVLHSGLPYAQFYELMGWMDVCLPAFPKDSDAYFVHQATSTILVCLENNVPILAINELRESYAEIDDDKITITRSAAMSEVQAIRALRVGDASTFLASDPANSGVRMGDHRGIREAVERMMKSGWVKTKEAFDYRKQKIWERNDIVMMRVLRDL